MLVGIGFDIHRHSQEDALYLSGLKIDGPGFEAHSDGDILLHTLLTHCRLFGQYG